MKKVKNMDIANNETTQRSSFPNIMGGVAGKFARLYSRYLEAPVQFFYTAFLTCLGAILSDRLTLDSELKPQPRLYVILLGESGDARKSTAINKVVEFFQECFPEFHVSLGVSSAEGLQKALQRDPKLLLVFDEFKVFVSKCQIDTSVLLPMTTTLFESNRYESNTKNKNLKIDNAHLSILAASTVGTYDRMFKRSSFADIGMINRLFICPGNSERKHSLPLAIPDKEKEVIRKELIEIVNSIVTRKELILTAEAREYFDDWYKNLDKSLHAKRLEVYALRFMMLIAVNEKKDVVNLATAMKATQLMDWQLSVRRQYDPIDADNTMADLEARLRRALGKGPMTYRELERAVHYERVGRWFFDTAMKNLEKAGEIIFDKEAEKWQLR